MGDSLTLGSELGWRGQYSYDSPEVVALRANLQQHAGIRGLEVVSSPFIRHSCAT